MISKLHIKNFALIEDAQLSFSDKLVVLSGETGSGKSILLNAISFLLGERSDKAFIREGCQYAFVNAVFENISENVTTECKSFGVEGVESLIISRKLTKEGKSEIRVNGQLFNLTMLRRITTKLVDMYGQNQNQILLDENSHLKFVDDYCKIEELQTLKQICSQIKTIDAQLGKFGGDELSRMREKGILEFEQAEIDNACLKLGEDDDLENKKKKFDNIKKLSESVAGALSFLDENEYGFSVSSCLYNSNKCIDSVSEIDENLARLSERMVTAKIEIDDIKDTLASILDGYEFSENEYMNLENRIEQLKNIKRKYGGSIENALDYYKNLCEKLEFLCNSQEKIDELTTLRAGLVESGRKIAEVISEKRKQNAEKIEKAILCELKDLNMGNSTFKINFDKKENFTENGFDEVKFMFSANIGESLKPLAKIISGGEMSRFMLAFKVVMKNTKDVQTMIFDEIDSGVSGQVGFAMSYKLYQVSKFAQVFVVTHLANVAAMADQHFKISKEAVNGRTVSRIDLLDEKGELQEIARMAGSTEAKNSIEFAKELKLQATTKKGVKIY